MQLSMRCSVGSWRGASETNVVKWCDLRRSGWARYRRRVVRGWTCVVWRSRLRRCCSRVNVSRWPLTNVRRGTWGQNWRRWTTWSRSRRSWRSRRRRWTHSTSRGGGCTTTWRRWRVPRRTRRRSTRSISTSCWRALRSYSPHWLVLGRTSWNDSRDWLMCWSSMKLLRYLFLHNKCTEPTNIIPLRLGVKKMILVGDPKQLPATTFSQISNQTLYNRSLFERIIQNDFKPYFLNIQYRMHAQIRDFPSRYFYDNK